MALRQGKGRISGRPRGSKPKGKNISYNQMQIWQICFHTLVSDGGGEGGGEAIGESGAQEASVVASETGVAEVGGGSVQEGVGLSLTLVDAVGAGLGDASGVGAGGSLQGGDTGGVEA